MAFKLNVAERVGLLVLASLIALGVIITLKSNLFLRSGGYELIGSFTNIEGLTIGSEVRYRGFKVGKVMEIDPSPEDIKIKAIIKKDIVIPADSYLRVAFDGLVGMKYLEIRPGKTREAYASGEILEGKSTAGIVDFVDMGTQNLAELKKILLNVLSFVEDPEIQGSFRSMVFNLDKVSRQLDSSTKALDAILSDPRFQDNVKGTIGETKKTLSSANQFFESIGSLRLKPSGDIYFGNIANQVKANLDVTSGDKEYYRVSIGEGPAAGGLGIQDVLIARKINNGMGMKLGMINTKLGGGLDFYFGPKLLFSTDLYDINNKPGSPRLRLTSAYWMAQFLTLNLQADNVLNSNSANYSVGVSVTSGD